MSFSKKAEHLYGWIHPVSLFILRELQNGSSYISDISHKVAPSLQLKNPYGTVYRRIAQLKEAGLVEIKEVGKQKIVSLRNKYYLSDAALSLFEAVKFKETLEEIGRREGGKLLISGVLKFIERVAELPCPVDLFFHGSFARGQTTKKSDVDVFMVIPDSEKEKIREETEVISAEIRDALGVEISVITAGYSERGDQSFVETAKKGIHLRAGGRLK
jgi:DNA-binding transcriptional ArsR family regulator